MGIFPKGNNWYIDYYIKGRRKRKKIGPSKKLTEQVLKDVQLKIAKGAKHLKEQPGRLRYLKVEEVEAMRYFHLSPEHVQEAMERLDKLWTLYGHQNKSERSDDSVSH